MEHKKIKIVMVVSLLVIGFFVFLPNIAYGKKNEKNLNGRGISVGAAKVTITPDPEPLGAEGINDDLYARAISIKWKDKHVILVSLDFLGHAFTDITVPVRQLVEETYGINGDYVLVGSTHSHGSRIDIIGVYSGSTNPYIVGVYKPYLIEKIVEVIGLALDKMQRASVVVGSVWVNDMTFNRRYYPDTGPTDDELTALRFSDENGDTIATLVNFASHPVVTMTGTLISADFCGYLCDKIESEEGGVSLFFNGALGNINPSMFIGYESPYSSDDLVQYSAAEEYGNTLADYAELALDQGKVFKNLPLEVAKTSVILPIENPNFIIAMKYKLINREYFETEEGYFLESEISGVKMGPIEMVTVPGELFSEISLYVKDFMPKYGFLLGLTSEELGYIIPPNQWAPGSGQVGEFMSLSPKIAPILTDGFLEVIEALE